MSESDSYKKAMSAIRALYNDVNVTKQETIKNLKALIDDIEILLASLNE